MSTCVIIVAAGKGTRMGPDIDKLFLPVAGRPVVAHTWRRFDGHPGVDEIVLVVRAGMEGVFREMAREERMGKPYRLVAGGRERQDSVWNGLQAVSESVELVAIQDGARPCSEAELISDCLAAGKESGAAVAACPVSDTIKESGDGKVVLRHLDRSRLWAVQTPQVFRREVICRALTAVREKGLLVTDDTAACDLIGQPVCLVEGRLPNPKVTVRSDVPYIEMLLSGQH